MKKALYLCCAALLAATAPLFAREAAPEPEKETVIVDFFSRCNTVPAPYAETLRGHVLGSFAARGRHNLIDAGASRELSAHIPGTGLTTAASASADVAEFLRARAAQASDVGARYLVGGAIADYKFEHVQLPSSDSKKPPRQGFKATFRILVSSYDVRFDRIVAEEWYTLTASAPAAGDADKAALARIEGSLEYYIDNHFKFETSILELCPPDKKGRIRELFIHCGTTMGVKPGDLFLVYEEVAVGGVPTRQKIGKLRVSDVQNPTVARCKVTKGDAQVADAFLAGRTLICISDGEAFFH